MTISVVNPEAAYAGSRTRLPLVQCLRLAATSFGPGAVLQALPALIAIGPAVAIELLASEPTISARVVCWSLSLLMTAVAIVTVSRIAAIHICQSRDLSLTERLSFARSVWWRAFGLWLLAVTTISVPFALGTVLQPVSVRLADAIEFTGYVTVAVWCVVLPLACVTTAVELCDIADAVSRTLHFLLSRPVKTLGRYSVCLAATAGIIAAGWAVDLVVPTRLPLILAIIQATGFFVSSIVLTYLYLREQVDAIEWDELACEGSESNIPIPLSGRAAANRVAANQ